MVEIGQRGGDAQLLARGAEVEASAPPDLRDHFRTVARCKVDKDRSVSLHGKLYEAPVGLIGNTVVLRFHDADPTRVEVFFEERFHGFLAELNPHVNSRIRRVSGRETEFDAAAGQPADDHPRPRGGQLFQE